MKDSGKKNCFFVFVFYSEVIRSWMSRETFSEAVRSLVTMGLSRASLSRDDGLWISRALPFSRTVSWEYFNVARRSSQPCNQCFTYSLSPRELSRWSHDESHLFLFLCLSLCNNDNKVLLASQAGRVFESQSASPGARVASWWWETVIEGVVQAARRTEYRKVLFSRARGFLRAKKGPACCCCLLTVIKFRYEQLDFGPQRERKREPKHDTLAYYVRLETERLNTCSTGFRFSKKLFFRSRITPKPQYTYSFTKAIIPWTTPPRLSVFSCSILLLTHFLPASALSNSWLIPGQSYLHRVPTYLPF